MSQPIVFYSGGCRFCRWVARQLVRLAPQLVIVPTRSVYASAYLWATPADGRYSHWYFLDRCGQLFTSGQGALHALFHELGMPRIVCRRHALDCCDEWLKAHRHWFASLVPNDYAPVRFPDVLQPQSFIESPALEERKKAA